MKVGKSQSLALALVLLLCLVLAVLLGGLAKSYLWFLLGFAIGVACHEAGHLLFALLGSIPIRLFSIGVGPILLQGRVRETRLELRLVPLSGFVFHYPLIPYRRFWQMLFLSGGVLGNTMVVCLVAGLDAIGAVPEHAGLPLRAIVLAQYCLIIASLVPVRAKVAGIRIGTDGLQLLQILWGTHPAAQAGRAHNELLNQYSTAGGSVPSAPSAASSRILYQVGRVDRWTDAEARCETHEALLRELSRGDLSHEEEMLVLDALVTDGLVFGDAQIQSQLDKWSARALELGPEIKTLQGSRGAVLVQLGRYGEGKALLESMAVADEAEGFDASLDTLMSQVFLARAEFGLANTTAAQRLSAAARATAEALPDSPMKASLRSLADAALGSPS